MPYQFKTIEKILFVATAILVSGFFVSSTKSVAAGEAYNPSSGNAGDVIISEFMANPNMENGEWIELYNTTSSDITMSGWTLYTDSELSNSYRFSNNTVIPANGFLVLCYTNDTENNGEVTCDLEWNGLDLDNSGETLTLKDNPAPPAPPLPAVEPTIIYTIVYGNVSDHQGQAVITDPLSFATVNTYGPAVEDAYSYGTPAKNPITNGVHSYTVIQSAINDAQAGDTINVTAGTYTEDLSMPASKDNLNLVGASAETTIIKGVANVPAESFPLAVPNIEILGDNVSLYNFTIEGPDYVTGYYSSGMVIGGSDVEIYNNVFKVTNSNNSEFADVSQGIQTYRDGNNEAGDLSGLNIHNNVFMSLGLGDYGYEGIFINHVPTDPSPTDMVTVSNNQFTGNIVRAITSERSKTTISNNSIITNNLVDNTFQGINVKDYNGRKQSDVTINSNTIKGFAIGLRIGSASQVLSNFNVSENIIQTNKIGMSVAGTIETITVMGNNMSNNTDKGIRLSDTSGVINIQNNAIDSNCEGIYIEETNTSSDITVSYNSIANNNACLDSGVHNNSDYEAKASNNWWGDASGPYHEESNPKGLGNSVTDNVIYVPWYTNADKTNLGYTITATEGGQQVVLPSEVNLSVEVTDVGTVTVTIPTNTTVTGPVGWTGTMNAPTIVNNVVSAPSIEGYNTTVNSVIEIGFLDVKLVFDKAAKVTLPGQAGKRVGYARTGEAFTEITTVCVANDQATGDALPAEGDCKYDDGTDLIIWTKHFTQFATFTATQIPTSGSGGVIYGGGVSSTPTTYQTYNPNTGETTINGQTVTEGIIQKETAPSEETIAKESTTKTTGEILGTKVIADGSLVRDDSKRIYVIKDNTKYNIANLVDLAEYKGLAITDVDDADLLAYQTTTTKLYANNMLIRSKSDMKVYAIKLGQKRHVLNLEELRKNYLGLPIYNVSDLVISRY
ncbi:MAG: lamin tail domain-containing protein [bacterium]